MGEAAREKRNGRGQTGGGGVVGREQVMMVPVVNVYGVLLYQALFQNPVYVVISYQP